MRGYNDITYLYYVVLNIIIELKSGDIVHVH